MLLNINFTETLPPLAALYVMLHSVLKEPPECLGKFPNSVVIGTSATTVSTKSELPVTVCTFIAADWCFLVDGHGSLVVAVTLVWATWVHFPLSPL